MIPDSRLERSVEVEVLAAVYRRSVCQLVYIRLMEEL